MHRDSEMGSCFCVRLPCPRVWDTRAQFGRVERERERDKKSRDCRRKELPWNRLGPIFSNQTPHLQIEEGRGKLLQFGQRVNLINMAAYCRMGSAWQTVWVHGTTSRQDGKGTRHLVSPDVLLLLVLLLMLLLLLLLLFSCCAVSSPLKPHYEKK